ncbi:MAG: dihydropteroate synthase [Planctomycetaceae bacterium]|nr:dihydropteroate synthase [Planctomycetaceae bacterium]
MTPQDSANELANSSELIVANARQILFVTGRLAEPALRSEVHALAQKMGFKYEVQVLPITVAALLTVPWVAKRLTATDSTDLVVLPGYCRGELAELEQQMRCPVLRGPKDLRELPSWFGQTGQRPSLDRWDIEIIAEINHAPQLSREQLVSQARQLAAAGADVIDIGCEPGYSWNGVADAVRAVRDLGCRVSIDSLDVDEIKAGCAVGAELVLSVNQSNRTAAQEWGVEVVAIPDQPHDWRSLEETVEYLQTHQVPFRIDPILEPIGFGFAESLRRYCEARRQWPSCPIMMGVGNLTELTDVDSAGVNLLLLGICEELRIHSVLTTQVIPWAQTAVRELAVGRRLTYHSIHHRVPPKRLASDLVMLRDTQIKRHDRDVLKKMASEIRDWNFRLFIVDGQIACLGGGEFWLAEDPFELFDQIMQHQPPNLDPSHAFYLGYEMCKAMTAMHLGKNYEQDEALDWGILTVPETDRHRLKKRTQR